MADLAPKLAGGGSTAGDFCSATEPFALFDTWFAEASAAEINDANAMSVATVDGSGLPNVRILLLKGLDGADMPDRGFVFYTNLKSAKGREISANPKVALNFHWKSLGRQVRVRGTAARVSDAEADAYFASRPRGSRIGAWASRQSEALASRAELEAEIARLEAQYPGETDIARPPHWGGFRVVPLEIEFWCEREFRLHDRASFRRSSPGDAWVAKRLYP